VSRPDFDENAPDQVSDARVTQDLLDRLRAIITELEQVVEKPFVPRAYHDGEEPGRVANSMARYRIVPVRPDGGWQWIWSEPHEPDEFGDVFPTQWQAFYAAADNWDATGSGGRLSATLRGQATRLLRKHEGRTP
jgi:hypothetical protein